MYSKQTLYYLNQIGIRPWVTKARGFSPALEKNPVLIILTSSNFQNKAQLLFNKMLSYIGIAEDELLVINMSDSRDEANLSPLVILSFAGKEPDIEFNCPVIHSSAPDDLLSNPLKKKSVFKDLNRVKELLKQ